MRKRKPVLLNGEALMVDGKVLEFDAVDQEELDGKIDAPQVAQVGEVLTVEEVDADGKPKKWKTQTVETAPPDWMENVSSNPGFVKNRTHYKQIMGGAGNPGYKVNLLDGTHGVGDIILLQSGTTNMLQKVLMRGINSPDWDIYELCMLIKETDNNDKTYNLEVICKDSENIVEVNTLSEGNMKVLYSEQKKAFLAYYFISNLSTLSTDDKTKFTQTGVYVQLVGNDYSEYAELWATYRLYLYTKLSNKYLNIRQDPPDWNENDPTKPGYIKNRPFYELSEKFIGSIEFTATSENTMKRVVNVEDMYTIEGISSLSGAGPILKAYVDGQTCMSSVIFDEGIIAISGALNGMSDFYPGGNFNVTINKNGLILIPNETYVVKFYNAGGPFYKTISENFFPDTIFSQKNAPVKFGASNSGELINSTVQGDRTKASGNGSHAEGGQTEASSEYSHAEGDNTVASGYCSHAEGDHTVASGYGSHAECGFSKASSEYSHAEGYHTEASGYGSHAEGDNTVANKKFLSVSGSYNLYDDVKYVQNSRSDTLLVMSNDAYYESDSFTFDASTGIFTLVEPVARKGSQLHLNKFCMLRDVSGDIVYKLVSIKESLNTRVYYDITKYTSITASYSKDQYSTIVGNGTSDTERSNAYTLDWEGNAWFSGDVYVGSNSGTNKDEGSVRLATMNDLSFPVIIASSTTDGITTYTANKTFEEIKAAYENGANVYAKDVPYAGNAIPLTFCFGSANIVFSGITDINRVYCITINKNNNISVVSGRTGAPLYSWSELPLVMQNPPFVISVSDDKAPDGGGLLYYTYGKNDRIIEYDMITRTGNYYKVFTDRQNNEITLSLRGQFVPAVTTSDNGKILQVANGTWIKTDLPASLPTPSTAQVGQIVKVKAVDADGKITETETVNIPTIPQPFYINYMIATEQIGENEFGYTLRPIPTINDFIDLGITSAQVGQIIKVKAVDDFGNPHEWEAVDTSTIVSVTYDEETGNLQIGG